MALFNYDHTPAGLVVFGAGVGAMLAGGAISGGADPLYAAGAGVFLVALSGLFARRVRPQSPEGPRDRHDHTVRRSDGGRPLPDEGHSTARR